MKKIVALFLMLVMVFSMAACTEETPAATDATEDVQETGNELYHHD